MSLEAKVWKVECDRPRRLESSALNYEVRLEDWLCRDISLLNEKLLVVGRQIPLNGGGILDLLAVDEEGNLVVIELKRDKTPRDIVAQTLDYASCIQEFGHEELVSCTRDFLETDFLAAFKARFGHDAPESVNKRHRMYIVATSLDSATQRIVEYLSSVHGVDINAATFSYFNTPEGEFVARSMLLDEEEVERRAGRRPPIAPEQALRQVAKDNGVVDLWDIAIHGFSEFANKARSQTTMSFNTRLDEGNRAVISIFPHASDRASGLAVTIVFDHLARGFGIDEGEIKKVCGTPAREIFGGSWSTSDNCYYLNEEKLEALLKLVAQSASKKGNSS